MGYFPICVELKGRIVLLVGRGPQTDAKMEKLLPFGAEIRRVDVLEEADLTEDVAMVVAGDQEDGAAVGISRLCASRGIPVNVVDRPELCSFCFPALITRGGLTVSVSTAGMVPGAAAYLREQINGLLPDKTEEIMEWLQGLRQYLYGAYPKEIARAVLHAATRQAFSGGRVLSAEQVSDIAQNLTDQ